MSTDPMAGFDQAEAEAEARTDEARREQHYAEAVQAASDMYLTMRSLDYTPSEIGFVEQFSYWERSGMDASGPMGRHAKVLRDFHSDYGTPALLRVIADALEREK